MAAHPLQVGREIHLNETAKVLEDLAKDASPKAGGLDLSLAFREVSFYIANEAKQNFDNARSPDGKKWAALKQRRPGKRNKGKKGLGAKPLRNNNLLMNSMLGTLDQKFPGTIAIAGPFWLEQGTNLDYADYHQSGTMDYRGLGTVSTHIPGKKGIPAREFAGFNSKMIDRISIIIADRVAKQISG